MPWVHAYLRGAKVFARADAGGALAVEGGRVEIRYKPNDGKRYGARPDNLTQVSGELLPDETCGPASGVDASKKAASDASKSSGEAERTAPATTAARARRTTKPKEKDASAPSEPEADAPHAASGATAIHVYADGACSGNPGPAGIGVVVLDSESRVEISEYIGQGTNNIAELTAILRALGETAESERPLVIHTDSSYSIGVLQKGWKAKANQTLVAELRDLLERRRGTRLVYVPGHAGVAWNERADSLARASVATRKSTRHVVRAAGSSPRA